MTMDKARHDRKDFFILTFTEIHPMINPDPVFYYFFLQILTTVTKTRVSMMENALMRSTRFTVCASLSILVKDVREVRV